jgi:hypothetical protein
MNLEIGMADWRRAAMGIGAAFILFALARAWFDPGAK